MPAFSKDILTADQGVSRWRFENCEFGHVFRYVSTTVARTTKRMTQFDLGRRICVSAILREVLTADEGVCGWRFKPNEIRCVYFYCGTASEYIGKRMVPLNSKYQICPEINFKCIWKVIFM